MVLGGESSILEMEWPGDCGGIGEGVGRDGGEQCVVHDELDKLPACLDCLGKIVERK